MESSKRERFRLSEGEISLRFFLSYAQLFIDHARQILLPAIKTIVEKHPSGLTLSGPGIGTLQHYQMQQACQVVIDAISSSADATPPNLKMAFAIWKQSANSTFDVAEAMSVARMVHAAYWTAGIDAVAETGEGLGRSLNSNLTNTLKLIATAIHSLCLGMEVIDGPYAEPLNQFSSSNTLAFLRYSERASSLISTDESPLHLDPVDETLFTSTLRKSRGEISAALSDPNITQDLKIKIKDFLASLDSTGAPPTSEAPVWKVAVDPTNGLTYYWNSRTRETSWSPPRNAAILPSSARPQPKDPRQPTQVQTPRNSSGVFPMRFTPQSPPPHLAKKNISTEASTPATAAPMTHPRQISAAESFTTPITKREFAGGSMDFNDVRSRQHFDEKTQISAADREEHEKLKFEIQKSRQHCDDEIQKNNLEIQRLSALLATSAADLKKKELEFDKFAAAFEIERRKLFVELTDARQKIADESSAQEKNSNLASEIVKLRERSDRLEKLVAEREGRMRDLERERTLMGDLLGRKEGEIGVLKQQIEIEKNKNESVLPALQSLQIEKEKNSKAEERERDLKNILEDERRHCDLEKNARMKIEIEFKNLMAEVAALRARVGALAQSEEILAEKNSNLEHMLNIEISSHNETKLRLSSVESAPPVDIENLELVARLKRELIETQALVQRTYMSVRDSENKIFNLTNLLKEAIISRQNSELEIATVRADLERVTENYQELSLFVSANNNAVSRITNLEQENSSLKIQIQNLTVSLGASKNSLSEKDISYYESILSQMTSENARLRAALTVAENQIAETPQATRLLPSPSPLRRTPTAEISSSFFVESDQRQQFHTSKIPTLHGSPHQFVALQNEGAQRILDEKPSVLSSSSNGDVRKSAEAVGRDSAHRLTETTARTTREVSSSNGHEREMSELAALLKEHEHRHGVHHHFVGAGSQPAVVRVITDLADAEPATFLEPRSLTPPPPPLPAVIPADTQRRGASTVGNKESSIRNPETGSVTARSTNSVETHSFFEDSTSRSVARSTLRNVNLDENSSARTSSDASDWLRRAQAAMIDPVIPTVTHSVLDACPVPSPLNIPTRNPEALKQTLQGQLTPLKQLRWADSPAQAPREGARVQEAKETWKDYVLSGSPSAESKLSKLTTEELLKLLNE